MGMTREWRRVVATLFLVSVVFAGMASGQAMGMEVKTHQKISDTQGNFGGVLHDNEFFGWSVAPIGDVNGDGVMDLAVGSIDDSGGEFFDRGAVWIVFLNTDGTVRGQQKISDVDGGFTGVLDAGDRFGWSVAGLGDLDGDGVPDLAVGAVRDDDGLIDAGAVWLLFLNADGTVKSHLKISATQGGFGGVLTGWPRFGSSIAALGDVNGDGFLDLAVGARNDDDGCIGALSFCGAVWVLFLNPDGSVLGEQKISGTQGGFTGLLKGDSFGHAVAALGDLDGDGVVDMAVGALGDDDMHANNGAVWVLFLNPDGTVKAHQKISALEGGFTGQLSNGQFGSALASVGDLDGDGRPELAVGARRDKAAGTFTGALWLLSLNPDGTVHGHQKIDSTQGGFSGFLDVGVDFGRSVALLGDLDGDGGADLAVGAPKDNDGGNQRGSVWVLFLGKWLGLGQGLAGTHGVPALQGAGSMLIGEPVTVTLTGALENTTAVLVVGLSRIDMPFKGGVLVPQLDFLFHALATDPLGQVTLSGPWPPGAPAGTSFYYQYWVSDPVGPEGFAASNAISGTTP